MPNNIIYDDPLQLPTETAEARLGLAGFDHVVIDLDLTSSTGAGIRANETDHILIGTGRTVTGETYGLDLTGHGSTVTNQGTIRSLSQGGTALRLTGTQAYSVVNTGTITSAGLVIDGSQGVDRIINAGTLQTTGNGVLMDLEEGNDVYDGILGTANGIIKLGIGNDTAYGGAGSEIFAGGLGDDFLHGGAGNDTADYSDATAGVTVDLAKTTAQTISGGQGADTLIDIESLIGSAHGDRLTGNALDNTLQGGAGDDTLEGGQGNDRLEGGAGSNTARYSGSAAAWVDLTDQDGQDTRGYGTDVLTGITTLEGGSGADRFTGNDEHNKLIGNGGNDTLIGGKGNDTLEGGSGQDTAEFSGTRGDYTITDSGNGTFTVADTHAGRDGIDVLKDVRLVKFSGDGRTIALTNSNPTDITLTGTSIAEDKAVGSALGSLFGEDPEDDPLTWSLVSDSGGTFGLNSSGTGLVLLKALDHETAAEHTITVKAEDRYGGVLTETFTIFVRNVVETTPLVRLGTAIKEQLVGESGNDRLSGLGGNDALFGQIGADTLIGGAGSDTLVGGEGRDVFVFDQKPNTKSNLDYIQDFNPADDVIHLSRKFFTKIAKGALSSKAFVTGNQFKDKDDRILYHKEGGALFYDPDGSGSAKAIQFANLAKGLKISHKDFFVI